MRTLNTEPLQKELQIRAVGKSSNIYIYIFTKYSSLPSSITGGIINGKRVKLIGIPRPKNLIGADDCILGWWVKNRGKSRLVDVDHLDLWYQPHHDWLVVFVPTHLKNMLVKLGSSSPIFRGGNKMFETTT